MQQHSTHIDSTQLSRLLHTTFEQLPKNYFKAYESFLKLKSKSFFRESLISKWISIPASNNIIFKNFDDTYRIRNIFIPTINKSEVEFQVYLNSNGIIGINIGDDLENLIVDNIDTSRFIIEQLPISKFLTGKTDLEYLEDFNEIDDFLDNKYISEIFTIDSVQYYSIITLSDQNCIAIDNTSSVYILNKISGLTKLIAKRPDEFVRLFKDNKLNWLSEL